MENPLRPLFNRIRTYLLQIFSKFRLQLPWPISQPSTDQVVDLEEAGIAAAAAGLRVEVRHNMDVWAKIMLPFCLTAAIDIALVHVQLHSQFPRDFHWLSLTILLAVACFFVAGFINPKYVGTAKVLVNCSVFFTYTSFFITITVPVSLPLKITSWLVYAISVLAVVLSFSKREKN
ncbi:hypothetical protein I3843_15G096300 [Carya illinoinensis]|nr:hypothetical protein I3843_15G096300 [Carya illinoinensis]